MDRRASQRPGILQPAMPDGAHFGAHVGTVAVDMLTRTSRIDRISTVSPPNAISLSVEASWR